MTISLVGRTAFRLSAVSLCVVGSSACGAASALRDTTGPTIVQITTSTKSFAIDCPPTSVRVSARITDASGVRRAVLRYRVDNNQPYASRNMTVSGHLYRASVKGIELPAGPYGALEFYITAEDASGRSNRSSVDTSVQFLPCVGA